MNGKAPSQADAIKIIRGVGGKAFPSDYNWICPKGHESRSFELWCYTCQVDAEQREQWNRVDAVKAAEEG